MIARLRSRFGTDLLADAADRFEIDPQELEELDGYENLVYGGATRVLRISHDGHRDPEQVLSECRFIAYLASGGAPVAAVLRSRGGSLLERIGDGDGGQFIVTCFERAAGRPLGEGDGAIVGALGALLGEMHRLSAGYRPEGVRREAWHENAHIAGWRASVSEEPAEVRSEIERLYERLRLLPDGPEHAGLIHGDLHSDNVLWDGQRLRAIDFDDSLIGPWGMDLGTSLYYCRRLQPGGSSRSPAEQRAFALDCAERLVRGYRRVRPLDGVARRHLADFVRWRQIDLFLYLLHGRRTRGLDEEEAAFLEPMRGDIALGLSPLRLADEELQALAAEE